MDSALESAFAAEVTLKGTGGRSDRSQNRRIMTVVVPFEVERGHLQYPQIKIC